MDPIFSQSRGRVGPKGLTHWGQGQTPNDFKWSYSIVRVEIDSWSPRSLVSTAQMVATLAFSWDGKE